MWNILCNIYSTGSLSLSILSPASQLFCLWKNKSLTYHEQVRVQLLKVTEAIHWWAGGVVRQDDDIIIIIIFRRRRTLLSLDATGHTQKITFKLLYVIVFSCRHTHTVKVLCKWQTWQSKTSESQTMGLHVLPCPQNWREFLRWSICSPASAQKIGLKVKSQFKHPGFSH